MTLVKWFREQSLGACALYVTLLLVALTCTFSCAAAPQVISDAVQAELIQAGFTQEQAAAVGQIVVKTAEDMSGSVPDWLRNVFDLGILALFPAMGVIRNRSRATQLAALKEELTPKA